MKYLYDEMNWVEVRDAAARDAVAVVPFGSTEGHGLHLPCGVDNIIATAVARAAVAAVPDQAVVLPTVPYGFCQHHLDFPGAIDVAPADLQALAGGIARSLSHHGFRRILFVNGHATNFSSLDVAAKLVTFAGQALVGAVNWWSLAGKEIAAARASAYPGGMSHACELETSVMLYLRPDLVDMGQARREMDFPPSQYIWRDLFPPSPLNMMDIWSRISPTGVMGDATLASADKGERVFRAAVHHLARAVADFRLYPIRDRVDHHLDGPDSRRPRGEGQA